MRGAEPTPAQTGEKGLFRLVKQAHETYSSEVLTRKKSYRRFVLDFIHSKQYHDATDAWSKNEHQKNYCIVSELLENHEKLVCQYFNEATLNESQIKKLLDAFNTFEYHQTVLPEPTPEDGRQSKSYTSSVPYEPLIDSETIGLIAQLVNEVNLFTEKLDIEDVIARYKKGILSPVTSKNNARLVLLLDQLSIHGVIPYDWQSIIAKKRLIRSSSGRKFLNQHDLSSTLNRIKDTQPGVYEKRFIKTIDRYINQIKGKKIEQKKP